MTVCPRHRDLFGTRWRCNRSRCTIPAEMAAHKSSAPKAQGGLKTAHSAYVLQTTKMLVPVGSRMYSTENVLTFVVQYCWPNAERGWPMGEKRHRVSEHVAPEQCALACVSCFACVNATYLSLEIF